MTRSTDRSSLGTSHHRLSQRSAGPAFISLFRITLLYILPEALLPGPRSYLQRGQGVVGSFRERGARDEQ